MLVTDMKIKNTKLCTFPHVADSLHPHRSVLFCHTPTVQLLEYVHKSTNRRVRAHTHTDRLNKTNLYCQYNLSWVSLDITFHNRKYIDFENFIFNSLKWQWKIYFNFYGKFFLCFYLINNKSICFVFIYSITKCV